MAQIYLQILSLQLVLKYIDSIHLRLLYYMERKSTSYVKYGGPKVLGMALKYQKVLSCIYWTDTKRIPIRGATDTVCEKTSE